MKKIFAFLILMTASLISFSQQDFPVFGDSIPPTVDSLKARGLFVTDVFPQEVWLTCCGKDFMLKEERDGKQSITEYRTPEVATPECIKQFWNEAIDELKEKYNIIYITEKFDTNGKFCYSGAFRTNDVKVSISIQTDGEIKITYLQW